MSKRCKLQKEYYKEFGNYKGSGKYTDHYVNWLENKVLAINYTHCCKSDSEQLPSKDDVYSEIKRVTELYYNDDNARKSAFGLGFNTGVNFVNKDILK